MLEEFLAAEDIVRKDPRWQEAMRKRGITNFDLCMIDPWSTPNVEPGVGPDDGRFVSPLTWVRDDPDDNGYAHPVDGVVTQVDLDTLTVVSVEDYGVLPVPKKKANYSTAKITDPENVPYFPDGPRHGRQAAGHHPARRAELPRRRLPPDAGRSGTCGSASPPARAWSCTGSATTDAASSTARA